MNLTEHPYTYASYEPKKQKPHARRVKKLAGMSLYEKLKHLYETDGGFRIQTDLLVGVTLAAVCTIAVITILFLVA